MLRLDLNFSQRLNLKWVCKSMIHIKLNSILPNEFLKSGNQTYLRHREVTNKFLDSRGEFDNI